MVAMARGQGLDDLCGVRDAVPVAGDALEGVIHLDRRVAEMFHLLQYGIRQSADIGVATEKQDGQAIGVGHSCRRHHVGRARARRGCCEHEAAAQLLLGIGNRGQCHGLFVLAPPERQFRRYSCSASPRQMTLPWPKMPKPPPQRRCFTPSISMNWLARWRTSACAIVSERCEIVWHGDLQPS